MHYHIARCLKKVFLWGMGKNWGMVFWGDGEEHMFENVYTYVQLKNMFVKTQRLYLAGNTRNTANVT